MPDQPRAPKQHPIPISNKMPSNISPTTRTWCTALRASTRTFRSTSSRRSRKRYTTAASVPDPPPPTLKPQYQTLNPRSLIPNRQPSTQPSLLNHEPSTLNPQPSTPNPQPSTLNPQPSTPISQPPNLNPQPPTPSPNPQPSTLAWPFHGKSRQPRLGGGLQVSDL